MPNQNTNQKEEQTKQNRAKYDWTIQSDWAKEEFKFEL